MQSYYDTILNQYQDRLAQYQNKLAPQKTPSQIAEEQKVAAYQAFIATKEGADALNEVNIKFGLWYDENYGIKPAPPSKEVAELKDMIATMAKQIDSLTNQLK